MAITAQHSVNYTAIKTAGQIANAQKFHLYDANGFLALLIAFDVTGNVLYLHSTAGTHHDDPWVDGKSTEIPGRLRLR